MPEYSSTTITPADGVKTPAMNGSTSGNFTLSALRDFILASKGQANGLASLGADGKLTSAQLPDLADDVLVYASYATLPATGTASKIYITADNNKMYRWDPDLATPGYVELSVDLSAYATKTELAAEESAREASDSNLKDALSAIDHRVTNLEVKAGDEITVTYPDSTYGMDSVPPSVAPYAKVSELIGVSRVHNQLVNIQAGSSTTDHMVTFTPNADGTVTVSGTATGGNAVYTIHTVLNTPKTYLWGGCPSGGSSSTYFLGTSSSYADVGAGMIRTFPSTGAYNISITIMEGTNVNLTFKPFMVDLAVYFNTTDLSFLGATDSAKLATIQSDYPELLVPSDYDTGTRVDTTYDKVESVGFNRLDLASYMQTLGISKSGDYYSDTVGNFRTKTIAAPFPITWKPNTRYSFRLTGYTSATASPNIRIVYTDNSSSTCYLESTTLTTVVITSTAGKTIQSVHFDYGTGGSITMYVKSLCISEGTDTTTDLPYMTDTLTLPSPVTGKSAGSVHQIYYPETGEMTEPLGSKNLGDNDVVWTYDSSGTRWWTPIFNNMELPADNNVVANILCVNYIARSVNDMYFNGGIGISIAQSNSRIYVNNGSDTTPPTGTLIYALATTEPNSQATDPVLDPFIQVEGNGTIKPNQTQSTQIDSSMTAEYLGV